MGKEQGQSVELNLNSAWAFAQSFMPRLDQYPKQLPKGTYVSVKGEVTSQLIKQHLLGEVTLGAYALDMESHAQWVCFDADETEQWQQLLELAAGLASASQTAYIEPSRRGGHLWLFVPKVEGLKARRFAYQLLAEHGIAGLEVYPKQAQLTTGPGSFVRLPLGIHRKTGKRYHLVDLDGQPLAPTIREQMTLLASPTRITPDFIAEVLSRAPPPKIPTPPRPTYSPDTTLPLSEQIKASISVADFIAAYVALDSRGRGLCPFHEDHEPSFGLVGNGWHCFSCDKGGSILDFWMLWREKRGDSPTFKDTLAELARMLLK